MSGSFCTTGGMSRRLWHSDHEMPVIMNDDMHGMDHSDHSMHNMDNGDHEMDGMDHNTMGHDHSAHGMSMGSGTIMFMDGFHSPLFHSSENPPPCLNLFFPSWTLDSPQKFVIAMGLITFLGVLVEACGVWRIRCLRRGRSLRRQERLRRQQQLSGDLSQAEQSRHSIARPNSRAVPAPAMLRLAWRTIVPHFIRNTISKCRSKREASKQVRRYEIMAASVHAARACLGYLLMLAVMSYAIEFLVCTILGIVLGRYWFIEVEGEGNSGPIAENGEQSAGLERDTWGGGDACCGLDDEDEFHNEDDNFSLQGSAVNEPLLGSSGMSRRNLA